MQEAKLRQGELLHTLRSHTPKNRISLQAMPFCIKAVGYQLNYQCKEQSRQKSSQVLKPDNWTGRCPTCGRKCNSRKIEGRITKLNVALDAVRELL
jgi:hypothetical protein